MDEFEKADEAGDNLIESVSGATVEVLMRHMRPRPEERDEVKAFLRRVIRDAVRITIALERKRLGSSNN